MPVQAFLHDDAALAAWVLDLCRKTPDVYVRVPADVHVKTLLRDELGLDSIGRLCVFYALSDALGLSTDESAVETWNTLGDVLAFVRAGVKAV
jgi:acyl carrier protein